MHTTEDDFQHFLSYSGLRAIHMDGELRKAFYAGADVVACERCGGTGTIDAPTSADDPCCPECDGAGSRPEETSRE